MNADPDLFYVSIEVHRVWYHLYASLDFKEDFHPISIHYRAIEAL